MSGSELYGFKILCTATLVRLAMVGSIWSVGLAPQSCLNLAAGETAAVSNAALWQQGISTWNGNSYSPPATPPSTTDGTAWTPGQADPYSVPVDPNLYTEPLVSVPYELGPIPKAAALSPAPLTDGSAANAPLNATPDQSDNPSASQSVQLADHQPQTASQTMGDQVDIGVVIDEPPLHEKTQPWYQNPWRWMTTGWKNHAEFGLDGSQGNSDALALQAGIELNRTTDLYTLALDVDYRLASSRNVTTEDNGRFNLDYDRLVNESPWAMFGKFGLEWDKFKAFDLRVNVNGGVGYHWIRNDRTTFITRFGAGASRKFGAPIDEWIPEAVFGLEGQRQLNKYNKFKGKVDYFPNWEDFRQYRIVTDLGWEILLDDSDNLSLKFAVTDRYDSTPQGVKPNDFYYSVLLLVKF